MHVWGWLAVATPMTYWYYMSKYQIMAELRVFAAWYLKVLLKIIQSKSVRPHVAVAE